MTNSESNNIEKLNILNLHSVPCIVFFIIGRKIADIVFLEKRCRAEQVLERLLSLNFIDHEEVVKVPQKVSFLALSLAIFSLSKDVPIQN